MTLIGESTDYLDLIVLRMRQSSIRLPTEETLMADGDVLPYLIFERTGIEFKKKFSTYRYILYSSTDESIFLNIEDSKTSVELKGLFFLKNDYEDILKKLTDLFRENSWAYHSSRTDYAYTIKLDNGEAINYVRKQIDFLKLKITTSSEQNDRIFTYKKGFNANVSVVLYDKSKQIEEKATDEYKSQFKNKYGDTAGLIRVEFRLHHKRTNLNISKSLKSYSQIEIKDLVWEEIKKRVRLSKKILKIFNLRN